MRLFCLQLEASCLQWSFFSFFAYNWSFFAYSFSFFTYNWSFFAYNGKVRLIRALRDCKKRSLTVSKKAPTLSKKASPVLKWYPDIGEKIVLLQPPEGSIERWLPKRFYTTPMKVSSEPQTGFYRTFCVAPPPFQATILNLSLAV